MGNKPLAEPLDVLVPAETKFFEDLAELFFAADLGLGAFHLLFDLIVEVLRLLAATGLNEGFVADHFIDDEIGRAHV